MCRVNVTLLDTVFCLPSALPKNRHTRPATAQQEIRQKRSTPTGQSASLARVPCPPDAFNDAGVGGDPVKAVVHEYPAVSRVHGVALTKTIRAKKDKECSYTLSVLTLVCLLEDVCCGRGALNCYRGRFT